MNSKEKRYVSWVSRFTDAVTAGFFSGKFPQKFPGKIFFRSSFRGFFLRKFHRKFPRKFRPKAFIPAGFFLGKFTGKIFSAVPAEGVFLGNFLLIKPLHLLGQMNSKEKLSFSNEFLLDRRCSSTFFFWEISWEIFPIPGKFFPFSRWKSTGIFIGYFVRKKNSAETAQNIFPRKFHEKFPRKKTL